jgi:hypothetical protein
MLAVFEIKNNLDSNVGHQASRVLLFDTWAGPDTKQNVKVSNSGQTA